MADKKTFNDLGLSEGALKAINKKGFEEPTPIQALTIPVQHHRTGSDRHGKNRRVWITADRNG